MVVCSCRYSFGRAMEGPQHFTDIRRNVAILRATHPNNPNDPNDGYYYTAYAVSGVNGPGLPFNGDQTLFKAVACADGLGNSNNPYDNNPNNPCLIRF